MTHTLINRDTEQTILITVPDLVDSVDVVEAKYMIQDVLPATLNYWDCYTMSGDWVTGSEI